MKQKPTAFKVPNAQERKKALGSNSNLSLKNKVAIAHVVQNFHPIPKPKDSDWLWQHKETGQSFAAYQKSNHNIANNKRNVIYIQPLQKEIDEKFLNIMAGYCEAFYYPMKVTVGKHQSLLKNVKSRVNQYTEKKQYNATQILSQLKKIVPGNAFCMIGVAITDLYPRQSWNFVFGLASLADRAGVFSFARYDQRFYNEQKYQVDYNRILWSSAKVMTHQIGHMFGLKHCIFYSCLMNGSNTGEEGAKKPRQFCPVCLKKLQSNIKFDIQERYIRIIHFLQKQTPQDKRNEKHLFYLNAVLKGIKSDLGNKDTEKQNSN